MSQATADGRSCGFSRQEVGLSTRVLVDLARATRVGRDPSLGHHIGIHQVECPLVTITWGTGFDTREELRWFVEAETGAGEDRDLNARAPYFEASPRLSLFTLQAGIWMPVLLRLHGPVAQSGERHPRMAEARGSRPLGSTL